MIESLENTIQELKRVDHLFWVSLKYTRTVDVIKNTVERLVNVFDLGLNALLETAQEKKIIKKFNKNPGLKCDLIKKTFPKNKNLMSYVNIYLILRRIFNSPYDRREEYRRHVAMIVTLDGEDVDVDIDLLKEYYDIAKEFVHFVKDYTEGKREL